MRCTKLMHGRRRAFTLVELLVVIAIIGVLVALLLPALSSARQAANASGSASNLSSFGRGFELYATNNNGVYTSAAFDHNRDGDIRDYGWVADLITSKVANPGKALDLGSRNKINEKVGDYMGATSKAGDLAAHISSNVGRWDSGATLNDTSGETYFGGDAGAREVWNDGYNSNYATTWHFSRGDPNDSTGYASGNKNPSTGDGPLNTNHLSQGLTTAARVALMGPARAGDGADALVVSTAGRQATGASAPVMNDFATKTIVKANDLLVESFNDGMNVAYGASLSAIGGGTTKDNAGNTIDKKIHEFNDIEPLHQPKESNGTGGFAPILFADLHVEKVYDTSSVGISTGSVPVTASSKKGDGYLGNGTSRGTDGKISSGTAGVIIDANGYNEVADLIWLKRLRNIGTAGGGSNEGG